MADKKKNPHNGHRQRVRDKFMSDGNLDSFAEHNILEFLLFYSVPRSDTNELAHSLIDKFGSLRGVFDAPYEALTSVDGIGENSAVLLKLIPALAKTYTSQQTSDIKFIKSTADAAAYLKPKFLTMKNEALLMICMNKSDKILKCSVISNGGIDYTQVDVRNILFDILSCHATEIILAHNHPGGLCIPSKGDVEMTRMIANTLINTGTTFRNHIIIADNDYFSFADHSEMRKHLISETSNVFIANENEEEND